MKPRFSLTAVTLLIATAVVVRADDFSANEQQRRDTLHITVQQICPVSGERLGDHGAPVKVTVGQKKEEIFLCCQGCVQQKIDARHWARIHANIARDQQICPVMKKPLPKSAKWTIVQGRVVYVCCPPCTDKIAEDPATHLEIVDRMYADSVAKREGSK